MVEEIKKILKSLEGTVVAFGFKGEKFSSILNSNNKIISFDIMDEISKKNKKESSKSKKIDVTDLRKKYKKNKVNAILIDVDVMNRYMIYLIKETIYIGKSNVYLFGNKDKVDYYLNKYKRYNINFKTNLYNDNMIAYINISSAKNNVLKDKFYLLKDKLELFINMLSDILTS